MSISSAAPTNDQITPITTSPNRSPRKNGIHKGHEAGEERSDGRVPTQWVAAPGKETKRQRSGSRRAHRGQSVLYCLLRPHGLAFGLGGYECFLTQGATPRAPRFARRPVAMTGEHPGSGGLRPGGAG